MRKWIVGVLWMVRRFGLRRALCDERARRRSERLHGRRFDPVVDGPKLRRALWNIYEGGKDSRVIDGMLEAIYEAARQHGEDGESEDGATHEVGDLQDALQLAWARLTADQRSEVYREFKRDAMASMPSFEEEPG